MLHRIFYAVLLLLCAALAVAAWGYHAPYSYEPVGPRAFPLLLLALLILGSLYLLLSVRQPAEGSSEEMPLSSVMLRRAVICVLLFVFYAFLFETAGFLIASALFAFFFARLYGGGWLGSLIVCLVLSVCLYLLFEHALDVPLPLGVLSYLES